MTLGRHPMELLREELDPRVVTSGGLAGVGDRRPVKVAGMVVARQRPGTAKGVVFMLLEDEQGTINLIVPPPVAERCRLAIRTSGFVLASGRLEHREGTTNVLVSEIEKLRRPRLAPSGASQAPAPAPLPAVIAERRSTVAELEAALPAPHSFGRRGR
jgi:error-prone DNA polymerase